MLKKRLVKKYTKILARFEGACTFGLVVDQCCRATMNDAIQFNRGCRGLGIYHVWLDEHDHDVKYRQDNGQLTADELRRLHNKVSNYNNPNNKHYHVGI